jgi:hypothetical protein
MKKSKGFDFKALMLNHGEKFVAVLIALLAGMGLSSGRWSGPDAETTVTNLKMKASETLAKVESNAWPEADKATFALTPDVAELARRMAAPNETTEQFVLSLPFNEPLNRVREKRAAVKVLRPENPEQDALSVALAMFPLEEEFTDDSSSEAGDKLASTGSGKKKSGRQGRLGDDEEEVDEETRKRQEKFGPALGGPGGLPGNQLNTGADLGLMNDPDRDDMQAEMANRMQAAAGGRGGRGGGRRGRKSDLDEGMQLYGYVGAMSNNGMLGTNIPTKRIKNSAGVSARWVFNLREQRKQIAEALHISAMDPATAAYAEDFVDLHIERKQALPAADPWSGDWEPVLTSDIAEVLNESLGLDLEVVNPLVTRPVITMPLPRRAQGQWSVDQVSHKGISEFILSDEEKEIIRKRDERLAKEAEEIKAVAPVTREIPKGFSQYRGNANQIMNQMTGDPDDEPTNFNQMFLNEYNTGALDPQAAMAAAAGNPRGPRGANKLKMKPEELEKLRKKLFEPDATNRLLLVRFLDFTAERGHEYIYRVRLELNNPNFAAPVDELEQPELADQKTIFSDWSEPTEPILLPLEYRYYVNKVQSNIQGDDKADLSMYFEDTEKGTPVMSEFLAPVGVRIGGRKEVEVVDLSRSTLGPGDVDFRTRDLLCGVNEGPRLSSSDHPELRPFLATVPRGRKPVPDQILALTAAGELTLRWSGDREQLESEDRGDADFVLKAYRDAGWGTENRLAQTGGGAAFGDPDDEDSGGMGMMAPVDPLGRGNRRGGRRSRVRETDY